MMAQAVPNPPNDKKRVKVYELRNNDWFDRGTGFCSASFIFNHATREEEPRVVVHSEDAPDRVLLETKIHKEDGFQKQQDTLIVWTEPSSSIDMALSFQESEGCNAIWTFVSNIQQQLLVGNPDDALSDDLPLDSYSSTISLPPPGLGNLPEIQGHINQLGNTPSGRDGLAKYIISEDYIAKLIPLLEQAEDLEDLQGLHRLCNIMKSVILLNDTHIIEHVVSDALILGVVGTLEYDPDFPSHKANHRLWLGKAGRYKEVVRIEDDVIRRKIHSTYRLQYLKDVVLARILDDPTFSVLNSLIFFNQVDIVQHLQSNAAFLKELFGLFSKAQVDQERKKEAVLFIQQCCAIAKNLQQPARQQLYNNFLGHGLLAVINFALRHNDVAVRVGATDVLVSMIDHDPQMIRQTIFRQVNEKQIPLTDSLIDLLLVEADLGVKAQIADAIKVLLDPGSQNSSLDTMTRSGGEFAGKGRNAPDPQQIEFVKSFYEASAEKLFQPLINLKDRDSMDFGVHEVSLFIYLIEILCFFVRQHAHHIKLFVMNTHLGERIAQLLQSPEKYLKLTALKFFRNLIGLQDAHYNKQLIDRSLFAPILDMLVETMPRDNLLNSACLEFFDFIKRENIKTLIAHLVEAYREKMTTITYVDIFSNFIIRYDQTSGFAPSLASSFVETEDDSQRQGNAARTDRWNSGIKDLDASEEEYFNTSDDDEENKVPSKNVNGKLGGSKRLVDYGSDEDMESEALAESEGGPRTPESSKESSIVLTPGSSPAPTPPERLSEKRRREEDEEDDISKLAQNSKRRNSTTSNSSTGLKRKKSFTNSNHGTGTKGTKIAISLSPAVKTGGETKGGEDGSN